VWGGTCAVNRIYRLRWSKRLGCLVVTSERTKGAQGKKGGHRLLLATASMLALMLSAGAVRGELIDGASVTVPGDRANPWSTGDLFIGGSHPGELRIEDGGSVTSSSARVGGDGGGTSIVTISGDGSTWDVVGDVSVGQMGKGVLTIEHGGKLSSGQGLIADFSEAIGEVTVTGAGSNWSNAGQLIVGAGPFGAGTLRIEGGGTVDNTIGYIGGDGLGSVGTVTVSGKESVWKNTGNLYVSYQGNGTLSIEDGGTVRAEIGRAHV